MAPALVGLNPVTVSSYLVVGIYQHNIVQDSQRIPHTEACKKHCFLPVTWAAAKSPDPTFNFPAATLA
ncbi:hypothetical protein AJ78_06411 [Emergomyces pasteurianus Ep9510]|uniref:Uncharacterized protein n=1 Tax=Emergomyces pasteurianus Ep9510 TaxID=1447872 RepID=A0A1J9PAV4_9EURO|nr:hypothetical protein AJ78_06411 [Emergomyces pasteurianus Ep9510]